MKPSRISWAIFLCLFLVQAIAFVYRLGEFPGLSGKTTLWKPVGVIENTRLTPKRRIVLCQPFSGQNTLNSPVNPEALSSPSIAWVFGLKMDWARVTAKNLRWIPGISPSMARRLIRLRDIYGISDFQELGTFPHVGQKTINRLIRHCQVTR